MWKDIDPLVREIVTWEVTASETVEPKEEAQRDFVHRLYAMVKRHGIRNGKFDDSRKPIDSGRGERESSSTTASCYV